MSASTQEIEQLLKENAFTGLLDQNDINLVKTFAKKIITRKQKQTKESDRLGLYPILDPISWNKYSEQRAMLWPASEIRFETDRVQFNDPKKITPRQRELFSKIIGFFMPADGAIIENVMTLFAEVESVEESFYFLTQMYIESQHAEGYNNAARELFVDSNEFLSVKRMVDESVPHAKKIEFIQRYTNSDESRLLRMAASACMEGIFFMGLFPIIFYFIKKDLLPNFMKLNEQIFKDESLHCDFYCEKVQEVISKSESSQERGNILSIVKEAVEIEQEFIRYLLDQPVIDEVTDKTIGLTAENICKFVEMTADSIAVRFGMEKIYNTVTELSWTEGSVMALKTNKYEKEVTTYAHTSISDNSKEHSTDKKKRIRF